MLVLEILSVLLLVLLLDFVAFTSGIDSTQGTAPGVQVTGAQLRFWTSHFWGYGAFSDEVSAKDLECGARSIAKAFAPVLPQNSVDLDEALELSKWCSDSPSEAYAKGIVELKMTRRLLSEQRQVKASLNDQHCLILKVGPEQAYKTVHEAISGSRRHRSRMMGEKKNSLCCCTKIELSPGVHFLNQTIELGPNDANLTISAPLRGSAWLSGGKLIRLFLNNSSLQEGPVPKTTLLTTKVDDENIKEIESLFGVNPHVRFQRARWPNGNTERDQWGYASPLSGHVSIRAGAVKEWIKPTPSQSPKSTFVDLSDSKNPSGFIKNDSTMPEYNQYTSGRGGMCSSMWDLEEQPSYWCGNASAGGWAQVDRRCVRRAQLELPVGLELYENSTEGRRMRSWVDAAAGPAVIHAWHSQSWFTNMWSVSKHEQPANILRFSRGGSQGGRSWCACDECGYAAKWCRKGDTRLISGTWYIENVAEELDAPGEYFFNRHTRELKLLVNSSTLENFHSDGVLELVIPKLQSLITMRNTTNITLSQVSLRDTKMTYLERYGVPSGGDWALHKGAAVLMEDVSQVLISKCDFMRLDGNGVMLYGHVRGAVLEDNEFAWLGESAMASWGITQEWDGRDGRQPRGSIVRRNVVREIGIYEKQSSAWFQAKSCGTRLEDNVFFNLPRAAINFNDGFGGGNIVHGNLIFNTCRESGDHGAINSWDRMPLLWDASGQHGFDALPTRISANLIFANYGASQAVDNDDGSSFYHIESNAMFNSEGLKMDYGGHDSIFRANFVVVYPYDGQNCFNVDKFQLGHAHVFANNDCYLTRGKDNKIGTLAAGCENETTRLVLQNNRYYTPSGNASIQCGSIRMPLDTVQGTYKDLEINSTCKELPMPHQILEDLRSKVLSMVMLSSQ